MLECPFNIVPMWIYLYLHLGNIADAFIQSDLQQVHLSEERETIYRCRYIKDVHRNKCQALTVARLPIPHVQQWTIFKCKGVQLYIASMPHIILYQCKTISLILMLVCFNIVSLYQYWYKSCIT